MPLRHLLALPMQRDGEENKKGKSVRTHGLSYGKLINKEGKKSNKQINKQ